VLEPLPVTHLGLPQVDRLVGGAVVGVPAATGFGLVEVDDPVIRGSNGVVANGLPLSLGGEALPFLLGEDDLRDIAEPDLGRVFSNLGAKPTGRNGGRPLSENLVPEVTTYGVAATTVAPAETGTQSQ